MVWEGVETWCFVQVVHVLYHSGFFCMLIKKSLIVSFFFGPCGYCDSANQELVQAGGQHVNAASLQIVLLSLG